MGVLDFLKTNTIEAVGSIVDNVFTNDEEKSIAKKQLSEVVLKSLNDIAEVQGEVVKTELQGNWLQKSWRPLTMLTMVVILVCKWFGLTNSEIPLELEVELMGLLKIGIGGYIAGRSVEKVAEKVTENIDMPFLKKKQRK
jgi:hypothetical protein